LGTIAAGLADEATATDAWPNVSGWGSLAGVIGTIGTLVIVYIAAVLLGRKRQMSDHETQQA